MDALYTTHPPNAIVQGIVHLLQPRRIAERIGYTAMVPAAGARVNRYLPYRLRQKPTEAV